MQNHNPEQLVMPGLSDVFTAQNRIRDMVWQTPLIDDDVLARQSGAKSVHHKLECLQNSGSFKLRGASNKILSLPDARKKRGVITFSTGNHGKAVAYVASRLGIRAVVCLSEHVPRYRADLIKAMGAELAVQGASQDETEQYYYNLAEEQGLTAVEPFDDPLIVAGQGTISLEIFAELPQTNVLMVQLSGGGLLAGIAMAAKCINPDIHVIGVSIQQSPAMFESIKAGKLVQMEEKDTLADSLLGGIGVENHYTLPLVAQYVDEHIIVTEEQIKEGMFHIFEKHRLVAEGAAAVPTGALLNGLVDVSGKKVVTLLTGRTIDSRVYLDVLHQRMGGQ